MPPEVCPNCGADIPPKARTCPECGSDETTGWSEQAEADGLGLPDDKFNYEEFVEEEFGTKKRIPRGIHWVWWVVAMAIILLFVIGLMR